MILYGCTVHFKLREFFALFFVMVYLVREALQLLHQGFSRSIRRLGFLLHRIFRLLCLPLSSGKLFFCFSQLEFSLFDCGDPEGKPLSRECTREHTPKMHDCIIPQVMGIRCVYAHL
jgi:hypothetical protein